ncbi:CYFA0S01e15280g1_1 [Cyberlindnera fabianii]|uniref:CYFA0S01e15280g1_1 n=1 Tax=Cyberlindnera fabianii TaxID=36022 RepID=A0A061AKN5_CYBFA|nr:CYFA0S01e15280g1_1 [Cyberlindnera fabianii]
MLSMLRSRLAARVVAPSFAAATAVAPLTSQFSTLSITLAPKKKTASPKKAPAKKPAPKPKKIKRTVSAYCFFVKDAFVNDREELMAVPFKERAALLRQKWNSLSQSELNKYNELHEKDAERNAAEVAEKIKNGPPKRPLTGYFTWLMEERPTLIAHNPGASSKELIKLGAEGWKNLPEYEKQTYNHEAAKNLAKWSAQYAKWKVQQEAA